jgi:hypothetical protein
MQRNRQATVEGEYSVMMLDPSGTMYFGWFSGVAFYIENSWATAIAVHSHDWI